MGSSSSGEGTSRRPVDRAVEISAEDLQSLDPAILKELQEAYGLEIQVRSNSEAINRILEGLGRPGVSVGAAAEFTRGFDRTSPGYDKYYNRDYIVSNPADLVTNPAERLGAISLAEALRSLSPEQLAALRNLSNR